jgi:hypothetical protein
LVERRERADKQSGRGDQHQRQPDLGDDERAAYGKATVAGTSATGILERLASGDSPQSQRRRYAGNNRRRAGDHHAESENAPIEGELQRNVGLPGAQLAEQKRSAPVREGHSHSGATERHNQALTEEQAREPTPRTAKRHPHAELTVSRKYSRNQQAGDVRAGDE